MESDTLLVWGIGAALIIGITIPFILRQRAQEKRTREAEVRAKREGLDIPASLHPIIDAERCIGTGSCLVACPEQDILGIRSGQAIAVTPANCIGHGACERNCPVDAIQLVFGSATRGVDIPRIKETFETNVPGLFIVGELGGMGLIRNAFEQGRQCVEGLPRTPSSAASGKLDLVVIGCGPAGLSAALTAKNLGLNLAVLERENVGGTVRHYPRKKLVMTEPVTVPGFGKISSREILKEELIEIWEEVVDRTGLEVTTGVTVSDVQPLPGGGFRVVGGEEEYISERVVLAIGRRGVPRKLGIKGEDLPNVAYSLQEPEAFSGDRILVVGGGDSAVEAGLALAEQEGNEVRIAYRGESFSRAKPKNRERAEAAARSGRISVFWSTQIVENHMDRVLVRGPDERNQAMPNNRLFVFAGGELPTPFLERCGVKVDTKFGER